MKEHINEVGYRIYITDCLQNAPQGKFLQKRYADVAGLIKQDERSGDEIATELIKELGLKIDGCI